MLGKILDYLNIRQAGGIELYFATLLIFSAYSFNGIPLQVALWCLFFILLFFKRKKTRAYNFKPLIALSVYVVIHGIVYLFIADGNIVAFVLQIVHFGCIFLALPIFNIERLKGSLNLIALICMGGLLYQWGLIATVGGVHPIEIPFLEMSAKRLETFSVRPSSFFMEPAAYIAYMYIPLAFALIDRKFLWAILIILSGFLTSSTTGLLTSFIMLLAYVFTQKVDFRVRLTTVFVGALMAFLLFNMSQFETGIDKFEGTDVGTNMRLSQGPYVVGTMNSDEFVFGAPYDNAYQYCRSGRAPMVVFYDEEVFMSTIWILILKFGFIGLFLYVFYYYKIMKECRQCIPLGVCLLVTMFSSGYVMGITFVYTSIPMLLIYYQNKRNLK